MANIQLSSESAQAYVGYAASVINSEVQTMTSLQIAEVTGKQHAHVMRDIRNMVEAMKKSNQSTSGLVEEEYHRGDRTQYKYLSDGTQKVLCDFAFGSKASQYLITEASYVDAKGEARAMYNLNKKACLLLASGYDVVLRAKIIDRWEQLEYRLQEQTLLQDRIVAAKFAAEFLNLNEVSKLQMAKAILDPLGLPAPDYVPSKGVMHSAKELLKINGVNMSAQSLNKALAKAGILKQHTRPGKGGKVHKWYVITDSGERFGENGVCPQNPKQTQPLWYDNSFTELVSVAARELA